MAKKEKKVLTEEQKKKRKIALAISMPIVGVLLFVLILNIVIMPLTAKLDRSIQADGLSTNEYIVDTPLISAHRAGGDLAPEETMSAFKLCMAPTDYQVDIVEFDLHLTSDNQLVLLHDHVLDRTSNSEEYFGKKGVKVCETSLEELKKLNFGENFKDPDGNYPYRGLRGDDIPSDVKILTLVEILDYLTHIRPDLNYIIEIKDGGERGKEALDILHGKLVEYNILQRTIFGTFKGEISEYCDQKYPDLKRSSSIVEVLQVYYSFLYNVKIDKEDLGFNIMQIPAGLAWLRLDTKAFIDYCHALDLAVQYWTIDDTEEAQKLLDNGADCIITDNPQEIYYVIYK